MIHWTEDALWQKARLFVVRARRSSREGAVFPFWSTLALEMLGRCVLASINVCLLADIRGDDRTADNLFYACGIVPDPTKTPISIQAKTVFSRCERLIPRLSDYKEVREDLLRRRNEDVHSGGPGFQGLEVSEWIADYYRMCKLLLEYRKLTLVDFFGQEEADLAEKTILDQEKDQKKIVMTMVSAHCKAWLSLNEVEQESRKEAAKKTILRLPPKGVSMQTICPACLNKASLIGVQTFKGFTRLEGNYLTQDVTALPEILICNFCDLKIVGFSNLRAADLGGEFTVSENPDPVEFHEIDVTEYMDSESYNEPEYGND